MMLTRAFWFLAVGLIVVSAPAAACEKTLRWNEDPPFSLRRADGEIVGLSVDIVRETLRRMGCTARLVEMPWARALAELEAGRLDILPGTVRTPERDRFAHFSNPGVQSRNVLFVHTRHGGRWQFSDWTDLRGSGFKLGTQIGVNYGPEFERLMADPGFAKDVQRVPSRRSLWLMLDAGRIDGVVVNEATGEQEIQRMRMQDRVRNTGLSLSRGRASVAFSRKSIDEAFVDRYNKANETMIKDGTHEAILKRWGSPGSR